MCQVLCGLLKESGNKGGELLALHNSKGIEVQPIEAVPWHIDGTVGILRLPGGREEVMVDYDVVCSSLVAFALCAVSSPCEMQVFG